MAKHEWRDQPSHIEDKEYPEGLLADWGERAYLKFMEYAGIACGYMFKGFFLTTGGLLAWLAYNFFARYYV